MNENESIGTLISKRRKYMGLTQEELAGRIGVSKSAIAKWETDGGLPERDNLKLLSEAINVPIDVFYRIIRRSDRGKKTKVNITADVIAVLESYGYVIQEPTQKKGTKEGGHV